MAWKRSSERSQSPLESGVLLRESTRAFEHIATSRPSDAFEQYGRRIPAIVEGILQDASPPIDDSIVELVKDGVRDVHRVVETAFVHGRLSGVDLDQRIEIATHPRSVMALGILAARNEELMEQAIADYPGGTPRVRLSGDRSHLATDLPSSTAVERCPFAGNGELPPAPVFLKFCSWAATLAVMIDDESYQRRTS